MCYYLVSHLREDCHKEGCYIYAIVNQIIFLFDSRPYFRGHNPSNLQLPCAQVITLFGQLYEAANAGNLPQVFVPEQCFRIRVDITFANLRFCQIPVIVRLKSLKI